MEPDFEPTPVYDGIVVIPAPVTLEDIHAYLIALDLRMAGIETAVIEFRTLTTQLSAMAEGMKTHPLLAKMFGLK